MHPTCDLCGEVVGENNVGQSTADTVLCLGCLIKQFEHGPHGYDKKNKVKDPYEEVAY